MYIFIYVSYIYLQIHMYVIYIHVCLYLHRQIISNYRPISVLSILSKIFEKQISRGQINFISKYSIISDKKIGFQKSKSTADAILNMIEYIFILK